jgi:hypothetical protein
MATSSGAVSTHGLGRLPLALRLRAETGEVEAYVVGSKTPEIATSLNSGGRVESVIPTLPALIRLVVHDVDPGTHTTTKSKLV